jgi:hypothetical protein
MFPWLRALVLVRLETLNEGWLVLTDRNGNQDLNVLTLWLLAPGQTLCVVVDGSSVTLLGGPKVSKSEA